MASFQLKDMASMGVNRYSPDFSSKLKTKTLAELDANKAARQQRTIQKNRESLAGLKRDEQEALKQSDETLQSLKGEESELNVDDKFISQKKADAQSAIDAQKTKMDRKHAVYKKAVLVNELRDIEKSFQTYKGPSLQEKQTAYNEKAAEIKALGGAPLPQGYSPEEIIEDFESDVSLMSDMNEDIKKYDNYSSEAPRAEISTEMANASRPYDIAAATAAEKALSGDRGRRQTAADLALTPEAQEAYALFNKGKNALISAKLDSKAPEGSQAVINAYATMEKGANAFFNATGKPLTIPSYSSITNASANALKAQKAQIDVTKGNLDIAAKQDEVRKAITDDVGKVAGDWMKANRKVTDGLNQGANFKRSFNELKSGKVTPAKYAMLVKAVNKLMEPTSAVMSDDMKTVASYGGDDGGLYNKFALLGNQMGAAIKSMGTEVLNKVGLNIEHTDNATIVQKLRDAGLEAQAEKYIKQWDNIVATGDILSKTYQKWENSVKAGIRKRVGESQDYSNFRNVNALAQAGGGTAQELFATPEGQKAFSAAINSQLDNLVSVNTAPKATEATKATEVKVHPKGSSAEAEALMLKENKRIRDAKAKAAAKKKSKTKPKFTGVPAGGF